VLRLAKLHEHVVGAIDRVADRAQAHRVQPQSHPQGTLAHGDAADDARLVDRTQVRLGQFDAHERPRVRAVFAHGHARKRQRQAERRGRFPGQAQVAQAVGPVGRDAHFQHGLVETQRLNDFLARAARVRQDHDAGALFRKAQLGLGTDHAEGFDATDLAFLDRQPTRQLGPDQGHGHGLAGGHVGRAADDLQGFGTADIDAAERKLVRFGMLLAREHAPGDHVLDGVKGPQDVLDLQAEHRQTVGQNRGLALKRRKLAQPIET